MAKKIAQRRKPARKATRKPRASRVPVFTLQQLKQADACLDAQKEFQELFGKSAPLTAATLKKVVLSDHLGLWWIHSYLRKVGVGKATLATSERIIKLRDKAEAKVANKLYKLPDRHAGPQAKALAKQIAKLEQQQATASERAKARSTALYAKIAEIEEKACAVSLRYDDRISEVQSQLCDVSGDWRDQQFRKAELRAVRKHLPKLAGIAAAYLPGKNLSKSEGEIAES